MIAGQSMTEAMLGSGFNTKSNFNREFLRVTNHSPTDWTKTRLSRTDHAPEPGPPR
jgi:AraC-like DNA-binding protein